MTELLAVPALRRILMVNTILSGAWDTHLFVVPIFGVAIGLSATTIGIILASFAAATFVIRLVLPLIQRRVRSWTLVRAAMATAAVDFLLYPLFSDVSVLIVLSFILGLALGCCQPSMLALLHQHSPPGRAAEAVGLRMALINGSQVSLPLTFARARLGDRGRAAVLGLFGGPDGGRLGEPQSAARNRRQTVTMQSPPPKTPAFPAPACLSGSGPVKSARPRWTRRCATGARARTCGSMATAR